MTKEEFKEALLNDGWTEKKTDELERDGDAILMKEKCAFFIGSGNYFGIPYERVELRNGDLRIRS